jgi:outer membrane receptor for ferrienterochelin and colicin
VVEAPELVGSDSPTPTTLVGREQIFRTPGADRSNSLAMITNYVPGAYITHDLLHVRGGHQVSWLIDGVPVPNTNIASNVAPQVDPKDIEYLEVQRGSYSAAYGDRTYAVLNVVPRSGFERNREGEVRLSYGSFNQTNNQVSFGSHTQRFAYFVSLTGNRTDYSLAAPGPEIIHAAGNGIGAFVSLAFNPTPLDQLHLVASARRDFYQVPNDPETQAAGTRDVEIESDGFINFSWIRTLSPRLVLTVSPFLHFNNASFLGGADDNPVIPRVKRLSQYAGGQATLSWLSSRHSIKAGIYAFHQSDVASFSLQANDGSGQSRLQREKRSGNLQAFFLEDQIKPVGWLTLTLGARLTHFDGGVSETIGSPRVGVAVRLPRVRWVARGFYGRYYQAPPLSTVEGPVIDFAVEQGFGFLPLHGERNEEYQVGLTIPVRGWTLDGDYFHTGTKNLFDHNAIGNSNIFFPVAIERGRARGWEVTVRSPRVFQRAQIHAAYAWLKLEGRGAVTGGLTDFCPPGGYFLLDHDQRHTLNVGGDVRLPWSTFAATNVYYGSGFLDGDNPPQHLPGHKTFDISLGKSIGEKLSLAVHILNVANRRFLLDNSETFNGTHYADPRQIYASVTYHFHF